jgi:hypothetical protein
MEVTPVAVQVLSAVWLLRLEGFEVCRLFGKLAGVVQAGLLGVALDALAQRGFGLGHQLLFEFLARDLDAAIILHAGAGRDEPAMMTFSFKPRK